MKSARNIAILSTLALACSLSAFARDKNEHSVNIPESVKVAGTELQPGNYKVEWQGTGPSVQVSFLQHGKTLATVAGTLKTNDAQVTQDSIVTNTANPPDRTLNEIDFSRGREALVFQTGM